MSTQNWVAMGLAHLQPFQACFVIGKAAQTPKKKYEKHPALRGRDYTSASALCETEQERHVLKARFIQKWNVEQVLRVNPYSDMGRSTGPTNSELAPR